MIDFAYIQSHSMALLLLFALLFFLIILIRIQRSKNRVDLYYLILDEQTQQPSLHKVGQLVALAVSTWALINETLAGRLSDWLFGSYMVAWAATTLANKYLTRGQKDEPLPPQ